LGSFSTVPPFHNSVFRIWGHFPLFRDSAIPPFCRSVTPAFRVAQAVILPGNYSTVAGFLLSIIHLVHPLSVYSILVFAIVWCNLISVINLCALPPFSVKSGVRVGAPYDDVIHDKCVNIAVILFVSCSFFPEEEVSCK